MCNLIECISPPNVIDTDFCDVCISYRLLPIYLHNTAKCIQRYPCLGTHIKRCHLVLAPGPSAIGVNVGLFSCHQGVGGDLTPCICPLGGRRMSDSGVVYLGLSKVCFTCFCSAFAVSSPISSGKIMFS